MEFRVGDRVKITDLGKIYSTYASWFSLQKNQKNILQNLDCIALYDYNNCRSEDFFNSHDIKRTEFVIKMLGKHTDYSEEELALITHYEKEYDGTEYPYISFLINVEGITPTKQFMTVDEMKERLEDLLDTEIVVK